MISRLQPTCSPAFSIPLISLICLCCPPIDFSHNYLTFFFAFSFLLPRTSFHLSFNIITTRVEKQFPANCVIYRKVKNSLSSDYKHYFRGKVVVGQLVVGHICWPCVARVFVFISIFECISPVSSKFTSSKGKLFPQTSLTIFGQTFLL